jgi:hypothetical protein
LAYEEDFSSSSFSVRMVGRGGYVTAGVFSGNGRSFHEVCSRVRRGIRAVIGSWRSSRADFACARMERNLGAGVGGLGRDAPAAVPAPFFLRDLRGLEALIGPVASEAVFVVEF